MDICLSNSDIRRWLPGASVLTYTELAHAMMEGATIYDLMGHGNTLVLLYLTRERHGHWTCVFERSDGSIECFDSLGYVPDDELKFVPRKFQSQSNQNHTYLLRLLAASGKTIHYNKDALQISDPRINTCGRHVICRIGLRDLTIDDYVALMRSTIYTPDELVFLLTNKKNLLPL